MAISLFGRINADFDLAHSLPRLIKMRRLIWLTVGFLCLFYSVRWIPSNPTMDFPAFYSAGRLFREGKNPYSLSDQCDVQHVFPKVSCFPFAQPPLLLPLMAATAVDNFKVSRIVYGSFLWALFVLCFWPLKQLTHDSLHAAALLTFLPVLQSLQATQTTPLILLGVLLWAMWLNSGRDHLAGLALALAMVKPQIALALGLPLVFSRPKAFVGFAIGGSVIALYSALLVGSDGIRGLLSITHLMATTNGYYVGREGMHNFAGQLARLGLDAWYAWPAYVIGIAGIAILWRKFGTSLPLLSLAVIISIFFAPHVHRHDLSLLILPLTMFPLWAPLLASTLMAAVLGTPFLYVYINTLLAGLAGCSVFPRGRSTAQQSMNTASVLETT